MKLLITENVAILGMLGIKYDEEFVINYIPLKLSKYQSIQAINGKHINDINLSKDANLLLDMISYIEDNSDNIYFQIEEKSVYVYDIKLFKNMHCDSLYQIDGVDKKNAIFSALYKLTQYDGTVFK
jgi:hypothetical protein